jgi:hypothetical protein
VRLTQRGQAVAAVIACGLCLWGIQSLPDGSPSAPVASHTVCYAPGGSTVVQIAGHTLKGFHEIRCAS